MPRGADPGKGSGKSGTRRICLICVNDSSNTVLAITFVQFTATVEPVNVGTFNPT
jgi:hypothetical protein